MMTTAITGRHPWGVRQFLLTGLAICTLAGLFGGLALAVHDAGLFELDGNVADNPAGPPDDWANIFNESDSAFATAFINDSFANNPIEGFLSRTPEVSFFTGGGSKDTLCIQDPCEGGASDPAGGAGGPWLYDTVNDVVPDKNDIVTAFAAAYDDPADDHVIFYFGLDTYAVQGDSNAGFWFFRRPVGLNPLADGETQGTFFGDHSEGDIFVAVAYTGGGKVGDIKVYRWDSTIESGQKPVGLVLITEGADCAEADPADDVCGVVNSTAGEDPPWDYYNKDDGTAYDVPAFVEFGLDITAILGENIGCFSTFLAETRSSQSETAQLKDFALGAFPVCGIEVSKTDGDLSKVGDVVDYTIDIENTGRATLYKQSIIDSLVGDLTDGTNPAVVGSDCGASLASGETCTITLSYTVDAGDVTTDEFGDTILENEVTIVYTEFDDFTGLAFNESDGHVTNLFEPGITFDKSGSPTIIVEGTPVNYSLTLDGASSNDTPLLDCTIADIALGVNQSTELTYDGQVVVNKSKTWDPDGADAASCELQVDETYHCTNTARVSCEVRGFEGINELDEEDSVTVTVIPAAVALTVEKACSPYSKPSDWEGWTVDDKVDYTITIRNRSAIPLNLVTIGDTVLGDLTSDCPTSLAADDASTGGPDECVIVTDYAVLGSDPDPLINEVTVTFNDGSGANITTDAVSCTTDLLHPDLTLSKSCASAEPVPAGATANFEIKVTNAGDVNLEIDVVDNDFDTPINLTDVLLGTAPEGGCLVGDYGDGGGNPELDAADGCLLLEGGITATGTSVSNQVDVTATLPAEFGLSNVLTRTANDTCDVQQGDATRTWGFWKTHGSDGDLFDDPVERGYTCHVFEDHLGGTMNLGWKQVTSCEDLFAIFWAHRSRESDGDRRDRVCQTQIRCSGQVAAALLNSGLDNGAPLDSDDLSAVLTALTAAGPGTPNQLRRAINQACAPIAAYNESGDDVMIIDLDGATIPHADPNGTRSEANYPFADCNVSALPTVGNRRR